MRRSDPGYFRGSRCPRGFSWQFEGLENRGSVVRGCAAASHAMTVTSCIRLPVRLLALRRAPSRRRDASRATCQEFSCLVVIKHSRITRFEWLKLTRPTRTKMRFARHCLVAASLLGHCAFLACAQTDLAPKQLFQQALDAQERGDYDAAIQHYRDVVKIAPNLLPAWVNLGVSLVQEGRFKEAIQSYQTALALDLKNRRIHFYLALAYFKAGDSPSACRLFEELLRSDPTDFRAATLLAASEIQSGNSARALAVLDPLTGIAGDDPDFLWALATAQVANGKLRDGISSAERMGRQTNSAEAWKLAGENLLRLNEFPKAKEDLEAAVLAKPDLPGLETLLGQAREKNADYNGAIEAFHKAVEQNPKDFAAWLNLGSDQYFVRDLDAARTSLNQALALNPESAPALYALALVNKGQGKSEAAIAGLERVVTILPTWIEAHIQLAALYMQSHRTADGARERLLVDQLTEEERKAGPAKY
jgi:tetratricopeptide (TPR) repeat protein